MSLFPTTVKSDEAAIAFLAGCVQGKAGGVVSVTTATVSLTAAQAIGGFVVVSGGSTCTATLPSAASVVAAFPAAAVNQRFDLEFINNNSGNLTIAAGSGIGNTITGTAVVPTTKAQRVVGVITNVTPGSEAVAYYAVYNAPV